MSSLFDAATFLAQTAAPATATSTAAGQSSGGGQWTVLLMYGLMAGGFYFLFIAPQRKKQKQHEKMISELSSGDEIVTTGGIYGTITNVKDDRFVVRIADDTKIELGKGFIQTVVKSGAVTQK